MLKVVPPAWYFGFLAGGLLVHFLVPAARIFDYSHKPLGAALFLAFFGLSLYASSLFSKEKTEILPTSETNRKLATYGPFKYSRNPMYLGMVGSLLGIAVFVGTLPLYLVPLAQFIVLNFFFIPFEEAKLARIFGEQFAAYKKGVRRWL